MWQTDNVVNLGVFPRVSVFWPLITVVLSQALCRNLSQIIVSYPAVERSSF